jgi:extracellular elastinolytic metalloproteinase
MTIEKYIRFGAFLLLYAVSASAAYLTGPNQGDSLDIAHNYLNANRAVLGLSEADLSNSVVKDQYVTAHNGVTHIYLRQQHKGIEVFGGDMAIHIASDGSIIKLNNQFIPGLARLINTTTPSISGIQAVEYAALHLSLNITTELVVLENFGGADQSMIVSNGGISLDDIPVRLVYQQVIGRRGVRLAWNVRVRQHNHWDNLRIDAVTGKALSQNDWIVNENDYRVIPPPYVSPEDGVSDPWPLVNVLPDATASPFGWHDTDGVAGAEFTDTRGNNVYAQEDADADNKDGFRPDGGDNLIFDFAWDQALEPWEGTNQEAAIVNLFYWNNIIHDVFYHYGFDEVSGNFQENNYGNGGAGGDPVQADAQDGSGMNNANFGTPPDGSKPRMQMFLWDLTSPQRDGDFENGIIIHEYGHGISNRLVGGPSNVSCLWNTEQMGEGWSDWLALILTTKAGDTGTTAHGMGAYVLGEPPDGAGIRPARYTTDMTENDYTYADISSLSIPHGVGFVWATMLWEVHWALIDQYGFDPDIYTGSGGNNLAIQLVVDGMKLTACNPGFVDARDAILQADEINNEGANQCLIWEAFAKRGLGYSAEQGSTSSTSDGTEAFDLPPECLQTLKISKTANPSPVQAGGLLDYTLEVHNDTLGTLTAVTITDNVPADTTYVPDSADCGGSESGGIVSFPLGTMNSGDMASCTFQVQIDAGVSTTVFFSDDFEGGFGNWAMTGLWNDENEADTCGTMAAPFPSSSNAAYFGDETSCTYDTGATESGTLSMVTPVLLSGTAPKLTFSSYETTEGYTGYDERFVDISKDGGTSWIKLGELNTENVWYQASFDLTPYIGDNVLIRFRFESIDEQYNDYFGWMVDNVEIVDEVAIFNEACVEANEGDSDCASVTTVVMGAVPNPGMLEFSASSYNAGESEGFAIIEVARTGGSVGEVTVDYATSDKTATAPEDYSESTGTLIWADGEIANKIFTVDISDDSEQEGDESFFVSLGNPTGGAELGSPEMAEVTIMDGGTDCTNAQISEEECEALVALYKSTGGANWVNNANWNVTQTPCDDWFGVTCNNKKKRVIGLKLPSNNLMGAIPVPFFDLAKLKILDLSDNNIEGTDLNEFSLLTKLKTLLLKKCYLSGTIPDSWMTNLTRLKTLNLKKNCLDTDVSSALKDWLDGFNQGWDKSKNQKLCNP